MKPIGTELREVGEGIFAHIQRDGSWWLNNSGVVVRDGVAAVIDTCATRPRTSAFRERIAELTPHAPRLLINTHAHGDHTYGNAVFPEATVIAHVGCRAAMADDPVRWSPAREWWAPVPRWADLPLRLPDITIHEHTEVHCADRRVEVWPVGGRAHTDHDLVIVLDEVAFVGDLLFRGGTPLFISGSLTGYLEALPLLRRLAPRILVPGHGEPCDQDEVDAHERYVRLVLEAARAGIEQGMTPLGVARELDLDEFGDRTDSERIVLNLHRAFADVNPEHGFDMERAFTDAIAFHGGPLRTRV
ncbi:MBL fold metallo-hydrolase [Microbacterium soli]|uniref:MBL fold metallo-hydrolase n=1 Tax=Microbacterium soli TaxID=446075 RepID=A0ABP7MW29_9MICO